MAQACHPETVCCTRRSTVFRLLASAIAKSWFVESEAPLLLQKRSTLAGSVTSHRTRRPVQAPTIAFEGAGTPPATAPPSGPGLEPSLCKVQEGQSCDSKLTDPWPATEPYWATGPGPLLERLHVPCCNGKTNANVTVTLSMPLIPT